MENTDRIEKKILLRAPRSRVWRAISNAEEFGIWFGIKFEGQFQPGAQMHGVIVGTAVDPDVAEKQRTYAGKPVDITIDRIEPERLFAFRWHPNAVDPNFDYSNEPTTLIVFELEETPEGILLTVTESGFDQIPLERRAQAFTSNDQGWTIVVTLIERYLAQAD